MRNQLYAAISSLALVTGCLSMDAPTDDVPGNNDPGNQDPGSGNNNPPPPSGGGNTMGRQMFNQDVLPILQATCAEAACHGGTTPGLALKYIPEDVSQAYDYVVSYEDRVVGGFDKTVAPIIMRLVPGPHYTAAYPSVVTDEHIEILERWLDTEKTERLANPNPTDPANPTQPNPGQISAQLMREWSGCMDLATWETENVAGRWANKTSDEGPCIRCHVNGQASFLADNNNSRVFGVVTTNQYFMLRYFQPDVLTDPANPKMIINRAGLEAVGNAVAPHNAHPLYDIDQGTAYAALQRFYDATMARKAAGTCDPARLP